MAAGAWLRAWPRWLSRWRCPQRSLRWRPSGRFARQPISAPCPRSRRRGRISTRDGFTRLHYGLSTERAVAAVVGPAGVVLVLVVTLILLAVVFAIITQPSPAL